MLIDTHCHLNMIVKKNFDQQLTPQEILNAQPIIEQAAENDVTRIINVGTSLVESTNCVALAQNYEYVFATVGIHPNDCTQEWRKNFERIIQLVKQKEINKIVGIGECGLDFHYPDFNMQRQNDAFKAHIELALEHNLALVVHSRDAADETLTILDEYKRDIRHGVIHCFSYDQSFAHDAITMGFVLGIGGTITYPKNNELRNVVTSIRLEDIILETDAPFLPPQSMRGKQNLPQYIKIIAQYLSTLRNEPFENVSQQTTDTALSIFNLKNNELIRSRN